MQIARRVALRGFLYIHPLRNSQLDDFMRRYIFGADVPAYTLWELLDVEFPSDLRLMLEFLQKVYEFYQYNINFYLLKLTYHSQPAIAALSTSVLQMLNFDECDAIKVLTNVAEAIPAEILDDFYSKYDDDLHLLCWSFSVFAGLFPQVVVRHLEQRCAEVAEYHRLNEELQLTPQNYFVQAMAACIRAGIIPAGDYSALLFKNACDPHSCAEDIACCFETLQLNGFPTLCYVNPKNHNAVFAYCSLALRQLGDYAKVQFLEQNAQYLLTPALFPTGFKFLISSAAEIAEHGGSQLITALVDAATGLVGRAAVDDALKELEFVYYY